MASGWVSVEPRFASLPGIDPAVEWALGEGADYFFPSEAQQEWVPILVQFKEGLSETEFESGKHFLTAWSNLVRVSSVHTANFVDKPVQFTAAFVKREFFQRLLDLWPNKEFQKAYDRYIARISLGLPLDDDSLPVRQSGEPK
jgi:hypothetical protein